MPIARKLRATTAWALMIGLLWVGLPRAAGQDAAAPTPMTTKELVRMANEVEREVADLRGWEFKHPVKKDIYNEKQLRAYIEKKVFEEEYGGGRLERMQAFLRMIELVPADCDLRQTFIDVLLNQVGGFYDPDTKAFYMLNRADVDYGPLLTRVLIAHELTHALDDQHFDLDKFISTTDKTEDAAFAAMAVVEGSATILMTRYLLSAQLSGEFDIAELRRVMDSELKRSQTFLEAPRYFSNLLASYMCGMIFLMPGDMASLAKPDGSKEISKRVRKAFQDRPASSEQVLHPEKYWNRRLRDEPVVVKDADVERILATTGLHVVHKNTLGELLCAVLASPTDTQVDPFMMSLPSYWTNDAASGWGGDRFFMLGSGKNAESAKKRLKDLAGVWITLWDTQDDRDEFIESYEDYREDAAVRRCLLGRRGVMFFYGFDGRQRAELEELILKSPPDLTRDGRPWSADDS